MATIEIQTPVGRIALEGRDGRLGAVRFEGRARAEAPRSPELVAAAAQLEGYFFGRRRSFDLPLALPPMPFDRRVLIVVGQIPYGGRTSYGEVTARLGLEPCEVRRVAAAIGRNPLPIVIPCHRVVGADGSLTGYGGGLARKAQLLAHELGQLQLALRR
jgi:methylated-DNA-[protein]-cysteine S-methyltransferase